MNQLLPSFDSPPVIETATSVQFHDIKGFGNAFLGMFWQHVRADYPRAVDMELIEPQFERFGPDTPRKLRIPSFRIGGPIAMRLQMVSSDNQTMIQLQRDRFAFNWRRLDTPDYPRWATTFTQFQYEFARLKEFLSIQGLSAARPNQWEVTYVNQLTKGREWLTVEDVVRLLPGLMGHGTRLSEGVLESGTTEWHFALNNVVGRLHAVLTPGLVKAESGEEQAVYWFQLTARGPIEDENDILTGLEAGHRSIVTAFVELTSQESHNIWGRSK